ncbi:MAG: hypothetical protein U1F53_01395 [Burkholderiaceae bacterium]
MTSQDNERRFDDPAWALLAEPGDDVALGCESAMPFLTPCAELAAPDETGPWTPPMSM